jgi:hypothetical protein
MKNIFRHLFFKIFPSVIIFVMCTSPGFTQVGFDNPNPDSSALIDMKAKDKGLLIPRMTSNDRTNMTLAGKTPAHSLLVFDTDQNMFFVYDSIPNPDRWVSINPFLTPSSTSDITTNVSGNVGIGTLTPAQKLEVNGNIKASNDLIANGNLTAANGNISGALTSFAISTGNINSTGIVSATTFTGRGTIPIGGIIMWSGSIASIPAGWALCNGGSGTPNLSGRFIVGYDASKSTTPANITNSADHTENYGAINNQGGYKEIILTANECGIREHVHNQNGITIASTGGGLSVNVSPGTDRFLNFDTYGIKNVDGIVGRNAAQNALSPHENRPPYYVLAYIMRIL